MEKRKQKFPETSTNPLLFPVAFEFVSPYALEECVSRLKRHHQEDFKRPPGKYQPPVKVTVEPTEPYRYGFVMEAGNTSNLMLADAVGTLENLENNSTRVRGQAKFGSAVKRFGGVLLLLAITLLIPVVLGRTSPNQTTLVLATAIILLGGPIVWLLMRRSRNHLLQLIHESLGATPPAHHE